MKTQSDRAANREKENRAIKLAIAFIGEARAYRFLYGQPAHENPLVQKTHNESVLRHHTAARTALQGLIERGLTPPLQDRCQALLMPYGEPETSYAMNAEALRAWAEKLEQPTGDKEPPAHPDGPVEPQEYRVNGKLIHVPKQTWHIINTLWKADGKQMRLAELRKKVWTPEPPSDDAFKQSIKRTVTFLTKHRTGMSVHLLNGFVQLKHNDI